MRKMKLDMDALVVESFDTISRRESRGTVNGNWDTEWNCGWTGDACLEENAGGETIHTKCGGISCKIVCGSCTCQDTCQTCALCGPEFETLHNWCPTRENAETCWLC
jgi:hypothetical protein